MPLCGSSCLRWFRLTKEKKEVTCEGERAVVHELVDRGLLILTFTAQE